MTPDEFTISESFLDVGDGHQLYVQDWGNPKAKTPIIFLHGGPGAGTGDGHKQIFDPHQQRVILFDQRGAGKSLPSGSIDNNTTQELVDDIRKIANHYQLNKFVLTGGSWGSCLAFAYAIKYPKTVKAMVLRGIYTGSKSETEYLDNGLWRRYFPDVWEAYQQRTPAKYRDNPSEYHYKQIKSKDAAAVKASAYAYSELESSILRLDDQHRPENYEEFNSDLMRIELHYLSNDCFLPDRYIFKNARKLTMPVWLVQGRYDMVCPPETAYEIHKLLPSSQLIWTVAGHRGSDRGTLDVTKALLLQLAT